MRRAIALAILLFFSLCALAKSGGSHGASHSSHGSRSHSSSKSHASKKSSSTSSHPHYRKNYAVPGYTLHPSVQRDSRGRIKRSAAAKDAFKRQQPCPATGRSTGRCPGYVIDHVRALECGGADAPGNMQWQTTSAAKAKDRTERLCK